MQMLIFSDDDDVDGVDGDDVINPDFVAMAYAIFNRWSNRAAEGPQIIVLSLVLWKSVSNEIGKDL